jgi:hypothetical protein
MEKKFKKLFLIFTHCSLLVALALSSAFAEDISVTAKVDKTETNLEDDFLLSVTVAGMQGAPQPDLPALPDFTVQGGQTVSQVQITNFKMETNTIFNYTLVPKRAGDFVIGPASVTVKGKVFQSQPIQVRVLPAQAKPSQRSELFIEQTLTPRNPYLNQQAVYAFRFYRRVQVGETKLDEPEFIGFLAENMGEQRDYKTVLGGIEYLVTEVRKALYPAQTGKLTIGEAILSCQVFAQSKRRRSGDPFFDFPFFGRTEFKTMNLRSEPISVEVREVPREGRPPDFKGLVGNYHVEVKLDKGTLPVGDSATLNVVVSGNGNLRGFDLPSLAGISDFKVYEDRPSFAVQPQGNDLVQTKAFKRALVPLKAGEFKLPPVGVSYFDPARGRYEVAQGEWIKISVSPSQEKEDFTLVKATAGPGLSAAVDVIGRDILPPHSQVRLEKGTPDPIKSPVYGMLFFLPFCGFFASLLVFRQREKVEKDAAGIRRKKAYARARGELSRVKKFLPGEDPESFRILSRIIKDYLGDWFNISGGALAPLDAFDLVKKAGNIELAGQTREKLEKLEGYQFGASRASAEERKEIFHSIQKLVKELQKTFKK